MEGNYPAMKVSIFRHLLAVAACVTLGSLAALPINAQTLLYDISPSAGGSAFSGFTGNWGFNFSITQSILVGSLGLWD
jgi:hypothetical protein